MDFIRGLPGLLLILSIAFLFSNNRSKISIRIILSGLTIQFIIALLVFKWPFFHEIFTYISGGLVKFLGFGLEGAAFVFSDLARNSDATEGIKHNLGFIFAFQTLPVVVFFSAFTALLYYLGILQKVVSAFAWIMKKTMKLSGAESLSAAGNIFMGMTEAPLLVRPFIKNMSQSELHCLMTGGMATIAGSVMGAFVAMLGGGNPEDQIRFASYLLGASLMNAPAAIMLSKMFYPETKSVNDETLETVDYQAVNVIDALAKGATEGIKLALNIGGMLMVFIATIFALNWFLAEGIGDWFGLNDLIHKTSAGVYSQLSIEYILGQVFRVFAFAIGVEWSDSLVVGSLLGQKLVINEFVAYDSLSKFLEAGVLNDKSVLISTYALCGFANFGSIAIQIGGIGGMAPTRQQDISKMGFNALVAATLATMLTATIAGMMYGT